jgi:hypothetical protein
VKLDRQSFLKSVNDLLKHGRPTAIVPRSRNP